LRLALYERPDGVEAEPGIRVVYDLELNEASFGEHGTSGPALLWELADDAGPDAALAADVELDPATDWLIRCDRIDFPPGGIAYRHTHPGAGIRRLLFGSIRIEGPGGHFADYEPGGAWFEGFHYPVLATASATEPSAFVRVMLLPREWEGKRTISYVDPADEEKPKLQRPTVFFDRAVDL
jgi:hypothetical protein